MARQLLPGLLALLTAGALAQPQASLSEREQAQAERAELQERIAAVERRIRQAEAKESAAADALRESEQAISRSTRRLAELEADGERLLAERAELEAREKSLAAALAQRQRELAELLRQQYQQGGDHPARLWLSGENPREIERQAAYLGYLARARAAMTQQIAQEQRALREIAQALTARRAEWAAVHAEQSAQREARIQQQAERQRVLAQLSDELAVQRTQADRLKSDADRLTDLITDINRALAAQAAERARREAQQREREAAQAAAEAAERVRLAREQAQPAAPAEADDPLGLRPDEMVAAPADRQVAGSGPPAAQAPPGRGPVASLSVRQEGRQTASAVEPPSRSAVSPPGRFADLRGRLPMPAQGRLAGRFGEPRPEGGAWRGVFIAAADATPVRAVAPGTVVFSGWLRGFGNLIILDHGEDYLTVYGSNEAILRRVGDAVAAGDTIARAGATGGLAQSGIYFEIRHQGSPVDPLLWTNRQ